MAPFAGVLKLDGNSHGRSKSGRLYYRFVPRDSPTENFLVPWEKHSQVNLYVVVELEDTSVDGTPLKGKVIETLGEVSCPIALERYSLYGVVFASTAERKTVRTAIKNLGEERLSEDSILESTIAIDPKGCEDPDDAIGLHPRGGIAVDITDVPRVLEVLRCWDVVIGKSSTAYGASRPYRMLPKELGDLCALSLGKTRYCLRFQVTVDGCLGVEEATTRVARSYDYDDSALMDDRTYTHASRISGETDPHELIAWYMLRVNEWVGGVLSDKMEGIGRRSNAKEASVTEELLGWGPSAEYYRFHEGACVHSSLGTIYAHATSPIRRIVDIANLQALKAVVLGVQESPEAREMRRHIESSLDLIMANQRQISKTQSVVTIYRSIIERGPFSEECTITQVNEDCVTVWMHTHKCFIRAMGSCTPSVGDVVDVALYSFPNSSTGAMKVQGMIGSSILHNTEHLENTETAAF